MLFSFTRLTLCSRTFQLNSDIIWTTGAAHWLDFYPPGWESFWIILKTPNRVENMTVTLWGEDSMWGGAVGSSGSSDERIERMQRKSACYSSGQGVYAQLNVQPSSWTILGFKVECRKWKMFLVVASHYCENIGAKKPSGVRHEIIFELSCIRCLISSKKFLTMELLGKRLIAGLANGRAEYSTVLENVWEMREKNHASARWKERCLAVQPGCTRG